MLETHKSPRFDINGLPARPFTVTSFSVSPPVHWLNSAATKTRSELLQKRKQEFIPDITYDIDGDGFVDHKDMAIAKMFDKNKDGVLDDEEKAEMKKAISSGMMEKYIWGLDNIGPGRHPRMVQRDGKFIGENNLETVKKTEAKTCRGIKLKEKMEKQVRAEEILNDWIERHPSKVLYTQHRVYSEPEFKTFTEKKNSLKTEARKKQNLTNTTDIKAVKEVNYTYVENPPVSGYNDFLAKRKQKMLEELHNTKNYGHVSRDQNFKYRENGFIHIIPENSDFLTGTKLAEKRKNEINEYNLKTFSNPSIGIHGKELPKFNDNLSEHWKLRNGFVQTPNHFSRTQMLTSRGMQKVDLIEKIGDGEKVLVKKRTRDEVTEKPGDIGKGPFEVIESEEAKIRMGSNHDYRLSTIFGYFLKSKNSQSGTIEPLTTTRKEVKKRTIVNSLPNELQTPKISSGFTVKAKSLIKKQGTSQRLLRSRGFLS